MHTFLFRNLVLLLRRISLRRAQPHYRWSKQWRRLWTKKIGEEMSWEKFRRRNFTRIPRKQSSQFCRRLVKSQGSWILDVRRLGRYQLCCRNFSSNGAISGELTCRQSHCEEAQTTSRAGLKMGFWFVPAQLRTNTWRKSNPNHKLHLLWCWVRWFLNGLAWIMA